MIAVVAELEVAGPIPHHGVRTDPLQVPNNASGDHDDVQTGYGAFGFFRPSR